MWLCLIQGLEEFVGGKGRGEGILFLDQSKGIYIKKESDYNKEKSTTNYHRVVPIIQLKKGFLL